MKTTMISIRSNFSENPSGRYRIDGPNSGERFRDEILLPALKKNERVTVDLDSILGFGSSFLEEAFGGLIRNGCKLIELKQKLDIRSSSADAYKHRAWRYIEEASARSSS